MHVIRAFLRRLPRDFFGASEFFDIAVSSRCDGEYIPFSPGEYWGRNYSCVWFRLTGKVPNDWKGCEVVASIGAGGETLVCDKNFEPIESLTDASVFDPEYKKELLPLFDEASGGEDMEFYLECTANGMFGMNMNNDPDVRNGVQHGEFAARFSHARFGVFNRNVYNLHHDVSTLFSYLSFIGEDDYRARRIKRVLYAAMSAYRNDAGNASKALEIVSEVISWPAAASALNVTAVGHAHIDTAWLWPIAQTVKKCARTFAGQLALIERFKDYIFGASSAFHYEIVKEEYPGLFSRIKEAVKAGNWEIQGGMYVEADCNLPCGESLARQFLYGKNFFMDEFGTEVKNLWLPDVFGYPASLPQIIKKSGCDYFLTQKISWSDTNRFPYNSFYWKGIDSTAVLSHFPPEDTYNGYMTSARMLAAQDNYRQSDVDDGFLSLFGIGDGGGGPNADFVERALRMRNFEGAPKVSFGKASEFFEKLSKRSGLPEWSGELYLELHRGTLTSQARNKRCNRKAEQVLLELETLFSALKPAEYPTEMLDILWKTLLINQFHDIIPGSSVNAVYRETDEDYNAVFEMTGRLLNRFEAEVSDHSEDALTLINTLSFPVKQLIEIPESWDGVKGMAVQGRTLEVEVGAFDTVLLENGNGPVKTDRPKDDRILENRLIRYEFDESGQLISIYDKELKREFLTGKGNVFSLYNDYPVRYEAWDIDKEYMDQKIAEAECFSFEKINQGALFSRAKLRFSIGSSTITQTVTLRNGSRLLESDCEVEWNETRRMLRVGFESSVVPAEASYDIQYGFVRRANHSNTSWEKAKFEVAHHRYFDLSERHCGIALLNDCKYGCRVSGGFFDLALLRSPKYPDYEADCGIHKFSFSAMPHKGDLADSEVVMEAASLNRRLRVVHGCVKLDFPVRPLSGDIEITAVKKAAKSDAIVVRMVEIFGNETEAEIFTGDYSGLKETNLIEWEDGRLFQAESGKVKLKFRPFEIRTFFLK